MSRTNILIFPEKENTIAGSKREREIQEIDRSIILNKSNRFSGNIRNVFSQKLILEAISMSEFKLPESFLNCIIDNCMGEFSDTVGNDEITIRDECHLL